MLVYHTHVLVTDVAGSNVTSVAEDEVMRILILLRNFTMGYEQVRLVRPSLLNCPVTAPATHLQCSIVFIDTHWWPLSSKGLCIMSYLYQVDTKGTKWNKTRLEMVWLETCKSG